MNFCTLIKTERVLYDEIIFAHDTETIDISEEIPGGSSIEEESLAVLVTMTECTPVIDNGTITGVEGLFHIDMNVTILRPDLPDLELGYSFFKEFEVPISKAGDAFFAPEDVERAICSIVDIKSHDTIVLNVGAEPTLFHDLTVAMKLKLVVPNEQIFVRSCPSTSASLTVLIPA